MKKLNHAGIMGFCLCFSAIIFGIATNGGIGTIMNFIHIPSLIVTLGGSLFAVLATADSLKDYLDGLGSIFYAYRAPEVTTEYACEELLKMADLARREGLLSLEEYAASIEDVFLSKGIRLIVDGSDPELVKDIMENELLHKAERDKKRIRFWQDLGAFAPAWGMVGTLLGLINMMKVMGTDTSGIGAGMSLALITTLYGSVAAKLEKKSGQEQLVMEVTIEGVLSIQAGENTRIIREKMRAILETMNEEEEEAA